MRPLWHGAAWLAITAGACGPAPPAVSAGGCGEVETNVEALGVERGAILLGGSGAVLGLSEPERNAVVLVEVSERTGGSRTLCSGVLVSRFWVLTARHCFDGAVGATARVSFGDGSAEAPFATDSADIVLHASADAAAIRLQDSPPPSLAVALAPSRSATEIDPLALGVIAGFGLTQELELGTRLFAAVDIVANEPGHFVSSAAPLSGACIGDSGGPLLSRDRTGNPVVLGLLASGSGSCRGFDRYTRLDALSSLLELVPLAEPNLAEECGGLTELGACFSLGAAVWCEDEKLRREACTGDHACGFSAETQGFRCVPGGHDPCEGVSGFGSCDGSSAVRCAGGRLLRIDCASCDAACVRNPVTGKVGCGASG